MLKILSKLRREANRQSGKILLSGTALIAMRNWRLWQRDLALARRLRSEPKAAPKLSVTPKVSVLVAAWNEQQRIAIHLQSFLALTYPNIQLILCAGGEDATFSLAQQYAGERVLILEQQAGEGKQHSLARAYAEADGEIIYLTDADCIYSDEMLVRVLAPLIQEGEQVTTGTSRPLDEQLKKALPFTIWAASTVVNAHSLQYSDGLLGRNAAITRQAIEASGGLDFQARTGTDYQLAKRLLRSGFAIRFVPESSIASNFPDTLGSYRHKQSRWLRNLLIFGRQYQATKDVRTTFTTITIGVVMLVMPFVSLLFGFSLLVVWLLLLLNTVFSRLRYAFFTLQLYKLPAPKAFFWYIVPLILADFGVWALAAFDLLTAQRRQRW